MITAAPRWKVGAVSDGLGRAAGLRKGHRARVGLIGLWLAAVIVLGGLTAYSRTANAPLADPDPAYQRPGFLDVMPAFAAPSLGANLPVPKSRSVVFFTRPQLEPGLLSAVAADTGLQAAARLVVVACGSGATSAAAGSIAVVGQGAGCPAADLYRMRSPRDGGAPVGYAIVSSAGLVRYSTLDPDVTNLLDEVEHMARGVS